VLQGQLATVERSAAANELPDEAITSTGRLKITPLDNAVPDEAEALMQQAYSLLPHLKITELLLEVDDWTGFTRHFKHLKSGAAVEDRYLLLTTILADAINLGLSKMAESCPGTTYAKLTWLQAWNIRDGTYSAGFTDHVFALMHLLGFRFAPRIRDLADKRLYIHGGAKQYPTLAGLIGGSVNVKYIRAHWDEILRLAASIKQRTVTASLMLRKLGSYPRQNGLAVALHELGRIERTLFALDWMKNVELCRRVQIGLNKGEAKNLLARAEFLNRLGEIRDRSFENQRYRASGLNLVITAIVLWNTVYRERAIQALCDSGQKDDEKLLPHLSPLGWEHINLTGDYIWRQNKLVGQGKFRLLRMLAGA
jgi:hypothetical protein